MNGQISRRAEVLRQSAMPKGWYCDRIACLEIDIKEEKAENAKLRKYAKLMHDHINECCNACGERCICDIDALTRELGVEVE